MTISQEEVSVEYETIVVETANHVATATINRPEAMNSEGHLASEPLAPVVSWTETLRRLSPFSTDSQVENFSCASSKTGFTGKSIY